MQKRLDDNILLYLVHNEGKSVVAERFIRTLKIKIYKKMTASNKKSYLGYLNNLLGEYNNIYHRFTYIIPTDADYFDLYEEIDSSHRAPKFRVDDRVWIKKYKNVFSKGYIKN